MSMDTIARELAVAISRTGEFLDLKQARNKIEKNRELKNKMDEYKKQEEFLYSRRLSVAEAQLKAAELKKVFDGLSAIPEVENFLKAQINFNSMLQSVYKVINDTLDSNLKA